MTTRTASLILIAVFSGFARPAAAAGAKPLKTKSGVPVVVVNLVSPRPDCSINPGPLSVPVIREKPIHGSIKLLILPTSIPATGNCPTRKIPTVALVYMPDKDFVGDEAVQIEVEDSNRTTTLSYRITVQAGAEPL